MMGSLPTCVLIADTVKGRGVSFMEGTSLTPSDRLYRFHSGAPDDDTYGRALAELVSTANAGLKAAGADPLPGGAVDRLLNCAARVFSTSADFRARAAP